MKKLILTIGLVFILFMNSWSEEFIYREFNVNVYNDFLKGFTKISSVFVYYGGEDLHWVINYPIETISIKLTPDKRNLFLEGIKKYKEWNLTATREQVKLQKDISSFVCRSLFRFGDGEFNVGGGKVTLIFFSQTTTKHQLVIDFDKIISDINEYLDTEPASLYLWWDDVIQLNNFISDDAIQSYKIELEKTKKTDALFK